MAVADPITSDEIWYPLPSWPGYKLSSDWRLHAEAILGGPSRSGPRKFTVSTKGYLVTCLWRGGKKFTVYLHHIIAELAYGPTPPGLSILHHDDDKTNNLPSNLYFGTQGQNVRDAILNGHALVGEDCPWAKLTDNNVREIRRQLASGVRNCDLARIYGVDPSVISSIKIGQKWKWCK